tara:strand:+ start:9757 stop:10827 length:1071 start_codon:yes stop_codon:yes gene_type:complete
MTLLKRREFIKFSGFSLTALQLGACSFGEQVSSEQNVRLYGGFRSYGNTYGAACIDQRGELIWKLDTPARVHEVCLSDDLSTGAVVARRPGTFIQLFSPFDGQELGQLRAPEGLILEGHALFRTNSQGQNELWATASLTQTSESILLKYTLGNLSALPEKISIAGLGPHQMLSLSNQIVIAVGGWKSVGRTILNADSFASGLVFFDTDSSTSSFVPMPTKQLSARHLDSDGENLWVGMQLADPAPTQDALLYSYSASNSWQVADSPKTGWPSFNGYIASVAASTDEVVATSPQGHIYGRWDHQGLAIESINSLDISAATSIDGKWWISSGLGEVSRVGKDIPSGIFWDNHWAGHLA